MKKETKTNLKVLKTKKYKNDFKNIIKEAKDFMNSKL